MIQFKSKRLEQALRLRARPKESLNLIAKQLLEQYLYLLDLYPERFTLHDFKESHKIDDGGLEK